MNPIRTPRPLVRALRACLGRCTTGLLALTLGTAASVTPTPAQAQITGEQVISGDNGGWSVAWTQANNGRLYHLGDLYGIYRSDDRGLSWTQLNRGFQSDEEWIAYGVAVVPSNANKVYYYGGQRICRSLDGGETWPIYTTISREGLVRRRGAVQIAIKPGTEDEIWAVGRVNATDKVTLIRSTNGGSSFSPVGGAAFNSDNRRAHSIHFRPTNPNHIWVGTSNGVYASTDGGSNWALVPGTSGQDISAIGLSKVAGNNIAIVAAPRWVRAINATDWNNVSTYFDSFATSDNPGKGSNGHLLALRNGDFLLSDSTRNVFRIGPTGNVITLISSTRNNTGAAQTPAWADMTKEIALGDNWAREDIWQDVSQDNTIYSDGGAGPSISTDLGQTWTFICKGVRGVVTNKPVLIEGNTTLALFPANDKAVLVHNDGGNSDTLVTVAKKDVNYGNLYVMHQVMPVGSGQTIYAVGGKQGDFSVVPVMIKSTNSGANWSQLPASGLPSTTAMRAGNLIAAGTVDLNNSNDILVLMGADTGTIHRSTDGGQSFGPALGGIRSFSSAQENFKSAFLERDGVNPNRRYCVTRDDFGSATPTDFGFYTSDDKGATWTSRSRPFGDVEGFSVDPKTEGRIWQGTLFNLHTSVDGGLNWIQVDNFQGVSSIDAFNGRVLVYARRNNAPTFDLWYSPDNGATWQQLTNATWKFPSNRDPDRVTRWKFTLDPNVSNRFWCGGLSGAVYTFNATGSSPTAPAITTNPSNVSVTAGSSANFSVAASGNPAPTYQWQRAANGSSTYNNLAVGGSYSGVTSTQLTVSGTTTGMSGDRFRAVATNSQGSATSTAATLTVTSAPVPVITSSLTKSGNVGSALSYTITASNSPTSYSATGLPAGVSVNTSNGVISGTPTTSGTVNSTITATNSGGTGSATLVFTINAALPSAPVINSALTKSGQVASALTYSITANNSPTSFGASGLPAGLSINTSTGVISGTPAASGTVNTSISATNAGGTGSATLVFTIAADPAAPVKLTGTVIGTTGSYNNSGNTRDKAFDSDTNTFFDAPGANGNWVGLDLGTAQVINQVRYFPRSGLGDRMNGGIFQGSSTVDFSSGVVNLHTITANAPNSFTTVAITNGTSFRYVRYLSPNNGYGNVAEVEFYRSGSGGGTPAPVINSALTRTGTVGTAISNYTITATNSPTSYNATSLPAGLSVNTSTGVISGTPTASGTVNTTISATNAGGTGSATLVFTINAASPSAPVINSALTRTGTVGTSLSYTITATNSPTSYNATSLPAGLSVNTSTGVISGTPTASGTSNVSISATNAGGTGSATLVLTINPSGGGSSSVLTGTVSGSAAYNNEAQYAASRVFDGNTTTFFAPASTNSFVQLDLGSSTTAQLTSLRYYPRAGFEGRMVNGTFQASANGSTWVTLHTVTSVPSAQWITVTIINTNVYRYFRYAQVNDFADVAEIEFIGITGGGSVTPPSITSSLSATATQNSAFSYTITASNSPTSYGATGLPAGLSVNTSTGVISGTPTGTGTTNVSISATNAGGTGSATLVLTVNAASGGNTNIAFSNQGFESDQSQTPSGWLTWANTVANEAADYSDAWEPRTGSRHLSHWIPSGTYQVYTYRTLTGLTNGTYTVRAWTKSTGGQTSTNMTVKNYGGAQLTSPIPAGTATYTERVISGIQVTNGQLEVGFWSNTSADNQWIVVDDVSVTRN